MTTIESDALTPDDHNDFDLEVLAARRRRRLPLATAALAVGVVMAAAFIGGVEIQKHYGGTSGTGQAAGGASAFASRFRGAGGGAGAARGGGFGAAGGATVGTVTVIKGKTLYITDTSGNTVKVVASAGSRVTKTVSSTLTFGAIRPGDSVVVQGTAQKNGNITASAITLGTAGATFGGGGFGSGSRSGSGGTGSGGATGFGG